jgi:hypothetical protein
MRNKRAGTTFCDVLLSKLCNLLPFVLLGKLGDHENPRFPPLSGGKEYGVNFVLLNKIVCFVFMCHIVPICHFSVDLEFSHT